MWFRSAQVHNRRFFPQFSVLISALIVASCATPQVQREPTPEEIIQKERELSASLALEIEKDFTFKKDSVTEAYLTKLAKKLRDGSKLHSALDTGASIRTLLIKSGVKNVWGQYSLPGVRIYLNTGLLKELKYENELAASIALEIAHVELRHLFQRNHQLFENAGTSSSPTKGKLSIFDYDETQMKAAIEQAVELLYINRYDPRGLLSLWNLYTVNNDRSPYTGQLLNLFIEWTHQAIVNYSPLRNPIVRTAEFAEIRKRIDKF